MPSLSRPRPFVAVVLDGWGISPLQEGNAIATANTPNMDAFLRYYPSAAVEAAGMGVGLPWGEVGNSETGHRNIGAGNVQYQVLPLIDSSIEKGDFFRNEALTQAIQHAKKNKSSLHILGMISPGGVHSHMNHAISLLEMCKREHFKNNVYVHVITDGRDVPEKTAIQYVKTLETAMHRLGVGVIASIMGRLYAMDRNKNWDRIEVAYNLLTGGTRKFGAPNATAAIEQAYKRGETDEVIQPTAITQGGGPIAKVSKNDSVIFFNFRADRARQITAAFVTPEAIGFAAAKIPNLLFTTMSQYDPDIPAPHAFKEEIADYPLARVISEAGLTQLHIAETEKYAHITYYLNVGHETAFPGEERVLINSSSVINFAEEPEMQAAAITDKAVAEIAAGKFDTYFLNFANPDMVGHTGDFEAAVRACAFVDLCLGKIANATHAAGGALFITADHGNAEEMLHPETGAMEKDHTGNPVPLHYVHPALRRTTAKSDEEVLAITTAPIGVLGDVAPTILEILGLQKPPTMTGVSLLASLR